MNTADLETSIYSLVYPQALQAVKQNISKGKINSPVLKKIISEELTLKEELKALRNKSASTTTNHSVSKSEHCRDS